MSDERRDPRTRDPKPHPEPRGAATPASSDPPAPRRSLFRRLAKVALVLVLLLAVLVLAAPFVAGRIAPGRLERELEARLAVDAEVERVRVGFTGAATVEGLHLVDGQERPLLDLRRASADLNVRRALGGAWNAAVVVEGLELHVRVDEEGRWNLADLVRESPAGERPPPAERAPEAPREPLPRAGGRVRVVDGSIVVHAPDGTTRLAELELEIVCADLAEPARLSGSLAIVNAAAGVAPGAVRFAGEVTLAPERVLDADAMSGALELVVEALRPRLVAPVLAALGAPLDTSDPDLGTLDGTLELTLAPGLALDATGRLEARDVLRAGLEARARDPLAPQGSATATLTLDGAVGPAARLVAPTIALREGHALEGALDGRLEARATTADGALRAGTVQARFALRELGATDATGAPIDLAALRPADGGAPRVELVLDASADLAAGTAELARLELDAGPVRARGTASARVPRGAGGAGGAAGAGGANRAGGAVALDELLAALEGELRLDADLDRLEGLASELLDLGGAGFGGALEARVVARPATDADGAVVVESELRTRALVLRLPAQGAVAAATEAPNSSEPDARRGRTRNDGAPEDRAPEDRAPRAPRALGPLDLVVSQRARFDPRGAGALRLEAWSATSDAFELSASGELEALTDAATRTGRLEHELVVHLEPARALLAPLLGDLALSGGDLVLRGTTRLEPGALLADGTLEASALALRPSADGPRVALRELAARWTARGTAAGTRWSVADLEASAAELVLARPDAEPLTLAGVRASADLDVEPPADGGAASALVRSARVSLPGVALAATGELAGTASGAALPVAGEGRVDLELALAELGAWAAPLAGLDSLDGAPLAGSFTLSAADGVARVAGELTGERLALTLPAPSPEARESGASARASGESAPGARAERERSAEAGAVARSVVQEDVHLALDLRYDAARAGLDVTELVLRSRTGSVRATGELARLDAPAETAVDLEVALAGELARVVSDIGALAGLAGAEAAGALDGTFRVRGSAGRLELDGAAEVAGFRFTAAATDPEEPPLTVTDAAPRLELDAVVALERLDVELSRAALESSFARGTVSGRLENLAALTASSAAGAAGAAATPAPREASAEASPLDSAGIARVERLEGELVYVPDRLGALLAPWLPGRLSGAAEERVTFRFAGPLADLAERGAAEVLAALDGTATVGLGRLEAFGFDASGALALETGDGVIAARGDLAANGGTVKLDARLDLATLAAAGADSAPAGAQAVPASERPRSWIRASLAGVRANPELQPLLAAVHPFFAVVDEVRAGTIEGTIAAEVDLAWDGPLSVAALAAGWDALDKRPLGGRGRLAITGASIAGSPLLTQVRALLGQGATTIDLEPLRFLIRDGRLAYDDPWQWTVDGVKTTFTGSIGLDRTLALVWRVPVTEGLVAKHGVLAAFQGEEIALPIDGTVRRPDLAWSDTLKDLARKAALRGLTGGGGLGDILGGGRDKAREEGGAQGGDAGGTGDGGGGEKPRTAQGLLELADRLYAEGKKAEAIPLYLELREKHQLTIVYQLNKDRIKDRSRETP